MLNVTITDKEFKNVARAAKRNAKKEASKQAIEAAKLRQKGLKSGSTYSLPKLSGKSAKASADVFMKTFPPVAEEVKPVSLPVSAAPKGKTFNTAVADAFQRAEEEVAVKQATGKKPSQIISRAIQKGKKEVKKARIEANRNLHQSFQTAMAATEPAEREAARAALKQAAKTSQKLATAKGAEQVAGKTIETVIEDVAKQAEKQAGKQFGKVSGFFKTAWNAIKHHKIVTGVSLVVLGTLGALAAKNNNDKVDEFKKAA